MIHPKYRFFAILSAFLLIPAMLRAAESQPPPEGGQLPDIVLAVPEDPVHRQYLGLSQAAQFRIPDIQAEVVIVEIFSMY